MKSSLLKWLKNKMPMLWLVYLHKSQILPIRSWPCENELRYLDKIPHGSKAIALDIGANIGSYSFAFSTRLGFSRIYAVEPDPSLHDFLIRIPKVILIDDAMSDRESKALLSVPIIEGKPLKSRSTLNRETLATFSEIESYEVSCTTLDLMIVKNNIDPLSVGIVKIDVEGNEYSTLVGGREFLIATDATLLVEIEARHHRHDSIAVIFDFLSDLDFVPHYLCPVASKITEFHLADLPRLQALENIGSKNYVNNFIFIKERLLGVDAEN